MPYATHSDAHAFTLLERPRRKPQDLSRLNRDLSRVIVLDTHKTLVTLPGQRDNVLQIKRFRGDADDSQLFQIMAFLERTHAVAVGDP